MSEQTIQQEAEPIAAVAMGTSLDRQDGPEKVTGHARYAVEHGADDGVVDPLHLWLVQSTIAKGTITRIDTAAALDHPGVVSVVEHTNAARLVDADDRELAVLQDDAVGFRGQIVAVVLAETPEAAREGARLVVVHYDEQPHRVELTDDAPTYTPDTVNPTFPPDTDEGDVEAGLRESDVVVDQTYRTPYEHNNPMEPHALVVTWHDAADGASGGDADDDADGAGPQVTVFDSTQGVHAAATTLAPLFGLEPAQLRVLAPYVGGGFGSKGLPHSPEVAAILAARSVPGRAVKLAVTRQQMFALTGYRTATISHFRLGARRDGTLLAIDHAVHEQTSAIKEFGEQTGVATRMMYAAPHRRTSHRLTALDVAVPSWMRAPGEMPGMFAHEVAMDELAEACGIDPIELRERNEPATDPDTGNPYNDRRLVECLQRGAERFGWAERADEPRAQADGEWWVGTGVASSTYPFHEMPGNQARVRSLGAGRYAVAIGAVDIGTGARTVLTQIAADALGVPTGSVELSLGDTDLPFATVAGGSGGTSSWGSAVVAAVQRFRLDHGDHPDAGLETTAGRPDNPALQTHAMHSFGSVFAEVRVHRYTGELRVPRLLGVFSVGRVINPTTARSQFLGGLVMGLSGALFEESYRDPRYGHVVTQDLATYHVASHADVLGIEAEWLDEEDLLATPMGGRGIGEIGIVGTAAAIANAAHHATGVRVRELPLTADRFLDV